jgi:hypothetical protein
MKSIFCWHDDKEFSAIRFSHYFCISYKTKSISSYELANMSALFHIQAAILVTATALVFFFVMTAMPTSLNSVNIPVMTTVADAVPLNVQAGSTCFEMLEAIHDSGTIYL